MAGPYMNVVPQNYQDMVDLPANTTPVTIGVDAILCLTAGTVTIQTKAASALATRGQTDPDGSTHTIAMTAGMQINIACASVTGDGTFVGKGLVL